MHSVLVHTENEIELLLLHFSHMHNLNKKRKAQIPFHYLEGFKTC